MRTAHLPRANFPCPALLSLHPASPCFHAALQLRSPVPKSALPHQVLSSRLHDRNGIWACNEESANLHQILVIMIVMVLSLFGSQTELIRNSASALQ